MRALGNNQYEITNKRTGQKKIIKGEELAAYGLAAPQKPLIEKAASFLAPETTETFTEGVPHLLEHQASLPNARGNLLQATRNAGDQTWEAMKTILRPEQVMETGLQALLGRAGGPTLSKAVDTTKTAATIARYPTKKAVANATTKVAEKASEKGVTGVWDKISENFTRDVIKKYGTSSGNLPPKIKQALDEITATFAPPGLKNIKQTPIEILTNRRNILNAYGTGPSKIAQFISGASSTPEQKVASVLRTTFSKELKKLAPKTERLDKVYDMYSKGGKFGGSPVDLLKKYSIPAAAAVFGLPKAISGMLGGIINNR